MRTVLPDQCADLVVITSRLQGLWLQFGERILAETATSAPPFTSVAADGRPNHIDRERERMRDWPTLLGKVMDREELSEPECRWAMEQIVDGAATPAQIAGLAVALRCRGETPAEVRAFADVLLDRADRVRAGEGVLDIVGTGGDRAGTVNISTMSAIVAAAAGCRVVKHGSRSASSACGTADVLEYLGVAVDLDGEGVTEVVERAGIGFCLAAKFHRSLAHAAATRRELGILTVFNFLGPLTNPARPQHAAIGVAKAVMGPVLAEIFAARGVDAVVFRGEDGLDEITVTGPSRIWRTGANGVSETLFDPRELGIGQATRASLVGGDARHNARVVRDVLGGGGSEPVRSAVLLNAAAGILASRPAESDLYRGLADGMARATEAVDSGAALEVLDRWIAVSRDVHSKSSVP